MARLIKIGCLIIAVAAVWLSFGIKSGKFYFNFGSWNNGITVSQEDSSGSDSGDTDFA